jgi:uncharacterized protein YmfQ (DUF2313 family)
MTQNVTDFSGKLTARQIKAIGILAAGNSVESVAEQTGVSRKTIHLWLRRPDFKEAVGRTKKMAVLLVFDSLSHAVSQAAAKLIALLNSESEGVVLRACELILKFSKEHVDGGDLRVRVERLEAKYNQPN